MGTVALTTFKSQQDVPEKRYLNSKIAIMKIMLTTIVGLCMVTFSGAFPQVSLETTTLPPPEPGCRYEDIEFTELIEEEVLEKKCETKTIKMIDEYVDTVCGPVEEKRCEKHWIC